MRQLSFLPTFGSAVSRAKTSLSRAWARERDSGEVGQASFTSLLDWLAKRAPRFLSSKTCMVYSIRTKGATSKSLFRHWPSSGMLLDGVLLTAVTSESPNRAVECSLLGVIETGEVQPHYYLSPNAAVGMLRRANRMKRPLFPPLRKSLETLAEKAQSTKH